MKGALIIDTCNQDSYYIRDNYAYYMKNDKPLEHPNHIGNRYEPPFMSFPRIFDEGYMLKLIEYGVPGELKLPKLDLDYIIVAIEKIDYKIEEIRKYYPNAIIVSSVKEYNPSGGHPLNSWKDTLINTCNDADFATVTYHSLDKFDKFQKLLNKELQYLPVAIDIDYLYSKYYQSERERTILCYFAPTHMDRGTIESVEFSKYLSNKYEIELITPPYPTPFRVENRIPLTTFIEYIAQAMFCVNLDKWYMLGQQPLQCAALGTIHIGGITEASQQIWDGLATNDIKQLEFKFAEVLADSKVHHTLIEDAFKKLNIHHSLYTVRDKLKGITDG